MVVGRVRFFAGYWGAWLFCQLLARGCSQLLVVWPSLCGSSHLSLLLQNREESLFKDGCIIPWNAITYMLSPLLCSLVRSKSQVLPTLQGRGSHKNLLMGPPRSLFARPPHFKGEEIGPEGWFDFPKMDLLARTTRGGCSTSFFSTQDASCKLALWNYLCCWIYLSLSFLISKTRLWCLFLGSCFREFHTVTCVCACQDFCRY